MSKISFLTRLFIVVVYVMAACNSVKGWSCSSTATKYSRENNNVTFKFTVTVTSTPTVYSVYFYHTYLGAIVIFTGDIISSPAPGIAISGDITGQLNVTLLNVQTSSAGMYRVEAPTTVNKCVFLYILQKPSKPTIKADREPVIGENVTLTCRSKSNTIPSNHTLTLKYSWKINNTEINDPRYSSASLRINSVQKNDSMNKYTCTATEIVSSGFTSDSSDNFTVDVLYGPDNCYINTSSPYNIAEGNIASTLYCQSDCNPLCTCNWKNSSVGSVIGEGGTLNLGKVTRYQTGNYLCTCKSDAIRDTACSKSLFINVDYISFSIEGHEGLKDVVVDEFDIDVIFTCKLPTYLEPFVQMKFQDTVIKDKSNSNVLSFTRGSVTCLHTGVYTCIGSNQIGTTISGSINLFVRCSPRPLQQKTQNYTISLFDPVTLTFLVLAYPEPGPTGFTWHKQVGIRWIPIRSNTDLQIYSTELQTNLTILNVSQSDYGQYRVTVINVVGSYDQYIFLTEKDTEIEKSISGEVIQEKDITGFVIGICLLGGLCLVVIVYAFYVTVLLRRMNSKKGTKFQEPSTTTQAINLADHSGYLDRKAQSSSARVLDEYENSVQLYTQLDINLKDDKTTYDIIQKI